jgi:hypothetical protein
MIGRVACLVVPLKRHYYTLKLRMFFTVGKNADEDLMVNLADVRNERTNLSIAAASVYAVLTRLAANSNWIEQVS